MIFLQLFIVFLQIGIFGFGGGYSMISLIQGQVVTQYHWMTMQEFTDVVAISQMTPVMRDRIVNDFTLSLKAMPQEDWQYALTPPSYLMILPEDSVQTFFENAQVENNKTAFLSESYDSSTRTYAFPNLATLIKYQIDNAPDQDVRLAVLPVERTTTTSSSYYGTTTTTSAITHYMVPAGVKIRIDGEVRKIGITSCQYAK